MDNYLTEQSMQIILKAGDARSECMRALDAVEGGDFETADHCLEHANKFITEAHCIHTSILQQSVLDRKWEYSVLFSHAQDTLMTIYSELNLAKKICKIFNTYEKRLKHLEREEI